MRTTLLRNEAGYVLMIVSLIGLILAVILGAILPQLHTAQQTRAINNLNEIRAVEAARIGVHAIKLGIKEVDNVQDLLGYPISGTSPDNLFEIKGNYAHLFRSGASFQVYYSTGNDGTYAVSGSTNYIAGATTAITVEGKFKDSTDDGVIARNRGILWAIDQLSGATMDSTQRDEYMDEDGNIQFVSGVRGMDISTSSFPQEKGSLHIGVIVSRGGSIDYPGGGAADSDPRNDCIYFFNDGEKGTVSGSPLLSEDNPPSVITWDDYDFAEGSARYGNFDLDAGAPYAKADFKYRYVEDRWYFSIGNDGTWRGKDPGSNELWHLKKVFTSGTTPFQCKDNDGDGDIDDRDEVCVFIVVRSTGITAAPGPSYETDKTSVMTVNAANFSLPNPMRQTLESAFYLEEEPN